MDERIQTLELLVEELIKKKPQEKVVKTYMQKTGLDYTTDPLSRINVVLEALSAKEFIEDKDEK